MLDEPHAKINYHIKTLYKVGILELVEEKIKSGIVEKYYYPKAKNILIDKNVINISLKEENEEKHISKVDDIIDLFYKSVKNQVLEEDNIINYNDICLNNDEIIELNNAIKNKIEELIQRRNKEDEGIKYDIVMASIPVLK